MTQKIDASFHSSECDYRALDYVARDDYLTAKSVNSCFLVLNPGGKLANKRVKSRKDFVGVSIDPRKGL